MIKALLAIILLCPLVSAESIFLSDYLEEGETKVYETEEGVYVVNLLSVSDRKEKAIFRLNDEMSSAIEVDDSYVFRDGSEIVVRDMMITESGEGNDEVYYYFYGTGEGVLNLKNVSYEVNNELCNFDGQCENETKENCCYDCGCHEEEECENNRCILTDVEPVKEVVQEPVEVKQEVEPEAEQPEVESNGKGIVYGILVVLMVFIGLILWHTGKKKRIF